MIGEPSLPAAGQLLLGILALIAAIFDICYRRIPNWLVLAGIIAGFTWNMSTSGWRGLGHPAAGFGLEFIAAILLLFRRRVRKTFFNPGWLIHDLVHLRAPFLSNEELDVTTTLGLRLPHEAMIAVGTAAFIFLAQHGFKRLD